MQELFSSAASARSKYRVCLDQERSKKESDEQGKKRKGLEDRLDKLTVVSESAMKNYQSSRISYRCEMDLNFVKNLAC